MDTKLKRYKVYNFRSIAESDWIEVSDNSCLVGTNEAGKTNLLIALWKLNPANNEPIMPLDDFPRDLYSNYKADKHENDVFISADFILESNFSLEVAKSLKCDPKQVEQVLVERQYNGTHRISFPYSQIDSYPITTLTDLYERFLDKLSSHEVFTKEPEELRLAINIFIEGQKKKFPTYEFSKELVVSLKDDVISFAEKNFGKKQNLPNFFSFHLLSPLIKMKEAFEGKPVGSNAKVDEAILNEIPKFVYYSDYGNLDSEIYLPRVIEDFGREGLGESARAKARTLDVLFKYVKLSPKEIFELGNESKTIVETLDYNKNVVSTEEKALSEDEISEWADKKRERGILLRSAATQLTQRFKKWWLQGDYIFDFQADGRHFRINVSDSLRPEPIELEGRSRGLQWFFSFFLVFLVETKEGHSNTILLLDEPGLSLHPLAQYDLAKFFRKLSEDNQLIYTSHSPFLVDMDNLANVKAVYIDSETGRTKVSSNLRHKEVDAEKSIFPVHAALGLTVSDTLLLGCLPVLVEGPSDQIYLSLIKRYLIGTGDLKFTKEIVFIPTGGVRGMGPVTKLVMSRDETLPYVLLDSDRIGKEYSNVLKKGRYKDEKDKVLEVADYLGDKAYEIEDLVPSYGIIAMIDRQYRADEYFDDYYVKDEPIVDQIEAWAKKNSVNLEEGWKVDVARMFQNKFDKLMDGIPKKTEDKWKSIFEKLTS